MSTSSAFIQWDRRGAKYGGKADLGPDVIDLDTIEEIASAEIEGYISGPYTCRVEVRMHIDGPNGLTFELGNGTIKPSPQPRATSEFPTSTERQAS